MRSQEGQPKNKLSGIKKLTIGGATAIALAGAGVFGYEMNPHGSSATGDPQPTAAASATPTPSEASATPTPEWANPIKIESAQAAANRFGADAYSKNPANWDINEWGGAHLKETEKAVKVNTAGTVVEGWIKSEMIDANSALTIVVDPSVPMVEVNGATFWDFGPDNTKAGFAQVLGQVRAKEKVEQPGVAVIPICADLKPVNTVDVPVNKILSAEQAANRFGADAYSKNPANWDINDWGGAHLKETGVASLVNLNGATVETFIKVQRENGRDAVTFVVHSNVGQMRSDGATFWDFVDPNKGFQQLLGQVIAKEKVEQPDVTVLPAHDCAVK